MATSMTETMTAAASDPASGSGPVDLLSKFDPIIHTRETLLAAGVEDPFSLVMEEVLSPTRAICNGRDTILLGTYNYMGMTFDPDVIEAGKRAMDEFGAGTTGSRVLNGTFRDHRDVETALREVDKGVVEATQAMGGSTFQIVTRALLPEAMPGILAGATVTANALVSYTAMAGVVGAGGLGDLAIRFGYQRFQTDVMVVTVVLLLILVQILQMIGDRLVARVSHR
jgi:hypothetical protein